MWPAGTCRSKRRRAILRTTPGRPTDDGCSPTPTASPCTRASERRSARWHHGQTARVWRPPWSRCPTAGADGRTERSVVVESPLEAFGPEEEQQRDDRQQRGDDEREHGSSVSRFAAAEPCSSRHLGETQG